MRNLLITTLCVGMSLYASEADAQQADSTQALAPQIDKKLMLDSNMCKLLQTYTITELHRDFSEEYIVIKAASKTSEAEKTTEMFAYTKDDTVHVSDLNIVHVDVIKGDNKKCVFATVANSTEWNIAQTLYEKDKGAWKAAAPGTAIAPNVKDLAAVF